jgi:hypothetical protein
VRMTWAEDRQRGDATGAPLHRPEWQGSATHPILRGTYLWSVKSKIESDAREFLQGDSQARLKKC